jgi:anti-anti-sigma factor
MLTCEALPTSRGVEPNLALSVTTVSSIMMVKVCGALSLVEVDDFHQYLTCLNVCRPTHVVFDLSKLTFLSSLAMEELVTFRRNIVRRGGVVKLMGLQPQCWLAIQLARLNELFPVVETFEEAAVGW